MGPQKFKASEKEEAQIRIRQKVRDVQIEGMQKEMARMPALVGFYNSAAILKKAIKIAADEAQKKQLQAKLVAMALNL